MINTSDRIKNIVSVIENDTLVDVGTDHGFIAILAVLSGKVKNVIACDLNKGPLEACKRNIIKYNLSDNIKTVLSNGIDNVDSDYKSVTICGMGGHLIYNILSSDREKTKKFEQLVLQPQSDHLGVRKLVYELGFYIEEEIYFIDNLSKSNTLDKYYIIFNCKKGEKPLPSDKELNLGVNVKNESLEIYKEYINYVYNKSRVVYESLLENAKTEVFEKKEYYGNLLKYCEEVLNEVK